VLTIEKYGFRRGAFMRAKPRYSCGSVASSTAIQFVWFFLLVVPATVHGQSAGPPNTLPDASAANAHVGASLRVAVVDPDGNPIERQALVTLHNVFQETTSRQTTGDKSQTIFDDLLFGKYNLEANALGYLGTRSQVEIASAGNTIELKLTLQRDPAVDLEESDNALPAKTLHELKHAIRALNVNDLAEAHKRLEEAEKLSPANARVKFLLGYLYFAKDDLDQAQNLLLQATVLNPHSVRAQSLLGRVYLVREQYPKAVAALEQAVAAGQDSWMGHDLLADAYLGQHEYEKAHQQAQLAIDAGGQEASTAQLALGEASANQGKNQEAIAALKNFLSHNPKSIAAQHAQELLRKLEKSKAKTIDTWPDYERQIAAFDLANDLIISPRADLPPVSWLPASVDLDKPPVVSGLSCPDQQVIDEAGNRVQELVANVEQFAAVESIDYEKLNDAGSPNFSETRKFDYIAAVSQQPDVVLVDEYRVQRYDLNTQPDRVVDNGFAVLALVFHPSMRDAFQMTCEGLGAWHGKPAWLVHFQQRYDRPNHMQAYLVGTNRYPVNLKGRAWIAGDSFQIMRIESDMMTPMPQISLMAEHTVTEYAPVPFPKRNTNFWLPQSAEVYMQFRGQRIYRKHSFEKYMLFSVDAEDKVQAKHETGVPQS
jgi:tetratricopeptide (TPR) repeat protein